MNRLVLLFCFFYLGGCAGLSPYSGDNSSFRVIWSKNNDPLYDTGNFPVGLSSPFIYRDRLYAGHNSGYMVAYQLDNGRELWRTLDRGSYHARAVAVNDYIIYGNAQGRVFSRHFATGELKYSVDLGASVESEGFVYKGMIFFQVRNHKIYCLDVETGKILWGYRRSVPFVTTLQRVSTPVAHNGKLFVGLADGYVAAFAIEDGSILWEHKIASGSKFIDVDATPFVHQNRLLIGSMAGAVMVLDTETGKEIKQFPFSAARSPVLINDRIFLGTTTGEIVILDKHFNELTVKKIAQHSISSILLWKDGLAVSTVGPSIYLLDPQQLTIRDVFELGSSYSAIFGQMYQEDGHLAAISSRNRIYLFR